MSPPSSGRGEAHELAFEWFEKREFILCHMFFDTNVFVAVDDDSRLPGQENPILEAREILRLFTQLDGHLLVDGARLRRDGCALRPKHLGHRQITDSYLLGLVIRENAALVTRDRGILHLAGSEYQKHVVII